MIGNIQERSPNPSAPSEPILSHKTTGFPKAQHRSKKSAFLQSRQPTTAPSSFDAAPSNPDKLSPQELDANDRIVQDMTDQEREEERQAILSRFGSNISDVLRRARLARGVRCAPILPVPPTRSE